VSDFIVGAGNLVPNSAARQAGEAEREEDKPPSQSQSPKQKTQ